MKKIITLIAIISTVLLSGCSIIGEVNNSLNYVNEVTDYMNTAKNFANEIPQLAQESVTSTEAMKDLENELIVMNKEIDNFNEIKAPSLAEDIHDNIVNSNLKLQEGIDLYLANIKDGKLDPAILENSGIMKTINEITILMNQIDKLGL